MDFIIRQKNVFQRIVIPVGIVVLLMTVAINVYNHAPSLIQTSPALSRVLSNISALGMFVSIWLGVYIAHPMAFFAGASMKERFVVSFSLPVIWSIKLLAGSSTIYSGGDLAFWVFYPLITAGIGATLLNMGISEIICRMISSKRYPHAISVLTPSVVIIFLIGLIIVPLSLYKGGTVFFYFFVDCYTWLFS
jgi:hypothetical protein